jgi:hypothetical protein
MPRLSASVGYFRRIYGNFNVVDNEALSKSDFTQFSVVAPTDPRLETTGQTITGLFDQNRSVANRNVVKDAAQFGKQISHWNGVDLSIDTRLGNGLLLQGGASWGKTVSDNCDIVDDVPEALTGAAAPAGLQAGWIVSTQASVPGGVLTPAQFCHQETPYLALYKAVASYTIPWDIRISGTFGSSPGPQIAANQIYAGTAPGLGRPFTFGQVTANVVDPGTMWGDRLNQFDLRFSKIIRFGSNRLDLNVDFYNAFNSDAILTQQNVYGATWQNALSVIQPRFVKFGARLDF